LDSLSLSLSHSQSSNIRRDNTQGAHGVDGADEPMDETIRDDSRVKCIPSLHEDDGDPLNHASDDNHAYDGNRAYHDNHAHDGNRAYRDDHAYDGNHAYRDDHAYDGNRALDSSRASGGDRSYDGSHACGGSHAYDGNRACGSNLHSNGNGISESSRSLEVYLSPVEWDSFACAGNNPACQPFVAHKAD
jgi:hypothetical protein